jgi:hypothetical protein
MNKGGGMNLGHEVEKVGENDEEVVSDTEKEVKKVTWVNKVLTRSGYHQGRDYVL